MKPLICYFITGRWKKVKSINHKVLKGLHKGHKALKYIVLTLYTLRLLCVLCG